MKQKHWTFLFAIVLLGELIGIQLQNSILQFIFKPLIIPVVIGYFDSQINDITKGYNKWIVAALIFSWIGDVLLMFQDKKDIFFLLGLSSFLLAHVFYIIYFHQVRVKEKVKSNPWLLVIVVIYYAALISFLSPYLGDMKLPVRIYGIVISFMFMLALHMLFIKNKQAGKWMMIGALLFVLSDSLLALNKFYQSFEFASVMIILTYALAQLFIVKGAVDYFNSAVKE
ncbi:MAG: lysoplasmalogenase [Chitinophagaceae bacterium]|nr:lysoplasmalogenase [Chitinophagaceae bacterium]